MKNRYVLGCSVLAILIIGIFAFNFTVKAFDAQILTPDPTPIPFPTPTPAPTSIPTATLVPTPTATLLPTATPIPQAQAAYVIDVNTGNVLTDINSNAVLPIGSTAKIMTAAIAIEKGDPNQRVTIGQDAVDRVNVDGASSAGMVLNDSIPFNDMLYGLLLPSGADAATALADYISGSPANFVALMNTYASNLHLTQTHFADPDGLSPDTQSSAVDMLKLTRYAMQKPLFASIVKQQYYTVPATLNHRKYYWSNTNNALLASYNGMIGVKTGHSDAASYCLVFAAIQNNHYLMGVVLGSPAEDQRNQYVTSLLDTDFAKLH